MRMLHGVGCVVALAAAAWAVGCGDDEETPCVEATFDLRNGTWAVTETLTWSGHDSCEARGSVPVDSTGVLCNVAAGSSNEGFDVCCESAASGDDVSFDCVARIDLGLCVQEIDIAGQGTVTDTTFDLRFAALSRFRAKDPGEQDECDLLFGEFADACTLQVHSLGTWVSSAGDTACDDAEKGVPLGALVSRAAGPSLGGP